MTGPPPAPGLPDPHGRRQLTVISIPRCRFGSTVSYNAALPYFKDYMGLDSARYQAMLTASRTPWSIKPLIGIVSDVVPIRGYHKRWYVRPSPAGR